jgi:beta-lactamase class A
VHASSDGVVAPHGESVMRDGTVMPSRRLFLGGLAGVVLGCASPRTKPALPGRRQALIAEIESRVGGRVGLFAIATDSGKTIEHREDERFALCSTFKLLLVAAVLAEVDAQRMALEQEIAFGPGEIIAYSPVTSARVAEGQMPVAELAEAVVVTSDNSAANLLLLRLGGPSGLTSFLRAHGDQVTRLDRNEPSLNTNLPGDLRDTTTPRAMVATLRMLLTASALSSSSRDRLLTWMVSSETGRARLRAGLPQAWRVGDKTGTGDRGAANDVAIAWPPKRGPILVASYMSDSTSPLVTLNAAHAEIGRLVTRELCST